LDSFRIGLHPDWIAFGENEPGPSAGAVKEPSPTKLDSTNRDGHWYTKFMPFHIDFVNPFPQKTGKTGRPPLGRPQMARRIDNTSWRRRR
jgi:hypothetical protein